MKTAGFAMILICAASLCRADGARADDAKSQHRVINKKPKPAVRAKPQLAKPAPSVVPRAHGLSPVAPTNIRTPNATGPAQRSLRRPVEKAPVSLLSNVRHRSPNPPVIAGKRSPAGIDGRQIHRQP